MINLASIRKDYAQKELSPSDCLTDGIAQFSLWLEEAIAAQVPEPTAFHLATVDASGTISARVVLLKGVEQDQLIFYSNYHSRKGQAITAHPQVSLTFFWPELERQVRIEGIASRVSAEVSDTYFASRPYTSRLGAWASQQSEELDSKMELVKRAAALALKYPLQVPRPSHWGGYQVEVQQLEFWQGRPSRLHDRVLYKKQLQGWHIKRLSP